MYTEHRSIFNQHQDFTENKNVINKSFANVRDWFVDNKLSIHFGEDKTTCIFFNRDKTLPGLNIK